MDSKGLPDGLAQCGIHQCPMIRIGDHYRCVVEHADDSLGMQRVTDFVPGSETEPARLVFDSGRSLPLLCVYCGGPLLIADWQAFRRGGVGLHLVAIGYAPPQGDEPDALEFILAPGDALDDLPDELVDLLPDGFHVLQVHIDSVRGISLPDQTPRRTETQHRGSLDRPCPIC